MFPLPKSTYRVVFSLWCRVRGPTWEHMAGGEFEEKEVLWLETVSWSATQRTRKLIPQSLHSVLLGDVLTGASGNSNEGLSLDILPWVLLIFCFFS